MLQENNKIVAIQIGTKVNPKSLNLVKRDDFTTNKDYVGHKENIPVYINEKIGVNEIKEIMQKEFRPLPEGNYECVVRQITNKHGKDDNGNENKNRDIMLLELDVKGQDNYQYITFYMKGYSDKQMEITQEQIKTLCEKFEISIIEDIVGKEGILTSKINNKGYTNLYLNPKKNFFDWSSILKFDGQVEFPCIVKKFYKTKNGEKYNFIVELTIEGTKITDFVNYDLENNFRAQAFEWILQKLNKTVENVDQDINVNAKLVVKRVSKGSSVYYNKRISFDKPSKEHYWK